VFSSSIHLPVNSKFLLMWLIVLSISLPVVFVCALVGSLHVVLLFSAWVGFSSPSVCLSVCLSVCPQHNSKTNDTKVFKLGEENDLGIP